MKLVPIGPFSKMTRLSVKALRLYDQNGLLVPAQVDPSTGYRYYRLDQARRAEVIRILRSVDMPLEEIKVVLEAGDNEQISRQLLVHKERLAARLAGQQRMLTYLESIIQDKKKLTPYDVHVTETENQCIATVKKHTALNRIREDVSSGFRSLVSGLNRAGACTSGPPMILYHNAIDAESEGDIEICVPVSAPFPGDSEVLGRVLEGGTMAATQHQGPYEELSLVYHILTAWVTENGYVVAGAPREIYVNDPRAVVPEELLTRIEFPICNATN